MSSVLKGLFVFIVSIHGLIHLLAFVKAFKFVEFEQLTQPISKPIGIFWLAASLSMLATIPLYLLKKDWWWMVGLVAIIVSQK
jgi:hypothetical protein